MEVFIIRLDITAPLLIPLLMLWYGMGDCVNSSAGPCHGLVALGHGFLCRYTHTIPTPAGIVAPGGQPAP